MKKIRLLPFLLALCTVFCSKGQASYLVEQLGRNEHQIVQSLGAFVGNERAESQMFDITYHPSGNNVEGRMIINTADYRCTYRLTVPSRLTDDHSVCFKIELIIRDPDFLREFNQLFQFYPTTGTDARRVMNFGDKKLLVEEDTTKTSARYRTFIITETK
ncbi:MAG: hypothetical protein MJZ81_06830 [Bacteroidales bacterium]|nr:hypothetical protein [Bacteroidales bacterium]